MAEAISTPKMALLLPNNLAIRCASDLAAPVSSISFPKTAPNKKMGNHFAAKSTNPPIYTSV